MLILKGKNCEKCGSVLSCYVYSRQDEKAFVYQAVCTNCTHIHQISVSQSIHEQVCEKNKKHEDLVIKYNGR